MDKVSTPAVRWAALGYRVNVFGDGNWIHVYHEYAMEEPDSFVALVKSVQSELDGKIVKVPNEDMQYMIDNDPMKLVFQWDSCFGNVVIVQDGTCRDSAVTLLERHCKKPNEQDV